MNAANSSAGAETVRRWWPDNSSLLLAVLSLSLALLLTKSQWQTDEGGVALRRRLHVHETVLEQRGLMPYQEHAFLATHLAQWANDWFDVDLRLGFHIISGGGYLCILLATWRWLSFLGYSIPSIVVGLCYVAALAGCLLPYGLDHPSDTYGPAILLMALVAAGRGNMLGAIAISLAAGFLWRKNVFIAPVLVIHALLRRQWRELPWAVAAGAASLVGAAVYVMAFPNVREIGGVLTWEYMLKTLPKSIVYQLAFFGPPMLAIWYVRRQASPLVLATLVVYPAIIAVYVWQRLFLYEMRSFWIAVPFFATYLAAWCDSFVTGADAQRHSAPATPQVH